MGGRFHPSAQKMLKVTKKRRTAEMTCGETLEKLNNHTTSVFRPHVH